MTAEELSIKRFELEQKIQLEELELKRKDLELKIQEQKSKRVFTPLIISIVGGLITIITGLVLRYFDSRTTLQLEDKKFQSSLLLKATDAKTYDEFSDMLVAFQENGLLSLDSVKLRRFRQKRFVAFNAVDTSQKRNSTALSEPKDSANFYWSVVTGGDANLKGAQAVVAKSVKNGFNDAHIWYRQKSYRTCIGKYVSRLEAVNDLFDIKEKVNNASFVVRFDEWCKNPVYDVKTGIYRCQ